MSYFRLCRLQFLFDGLHTAIVLTSLWLGILCAPVGDAEALTLRAPSEVTQARALKLSNPKLRPEEIASLVKIGAENKALLAWMREDLRHYLENFEAIFAAKLNRIVRQEAQRKAANLEVHGYKTVYNSSKDFIDRFVGLSKKLLRSLPSDKEIRMMDRIGVKTLYVDTWAVPFFNTGTQTQEEAKAGLVSALAEFDSLDLQSDISFRRFTQLMALFARPEFDDVRRYKLEPFPSAESIQRFGLERSDARVTGQHFPSEAPIVKNETVDIDGVSELFGTRNHLLGLISHSLIDSTADGRIFTGPADFLEHDYAHEFFNEGPTIPGTPEVWAKIYAGYLDKLKIEQDPDIRKMMRLVYYHFTHESGFTVLVPDEQGKLDSQLFDHQIQVIEDLIQTRYHYDFILDGMDFSPELRKALTQAFQVVGGYFRSQFQEVQLMEQRRKNPCDLADGAGQGKG